MILRVDHLSKRFGTTPALDDVSMTLGTAERVAIVGPSGSGKSTLLRCVAGLERPDAGDVSLNGRRINDAPPHERQIALLFQTSTLLPHLSVEEHLLLPARLGGGVTPILRERIASLAKHFQIEEVARRRPAELSAGQRQRVELARCLVKKPAVLMLDEPMTHLDVMLRRSLRDVIRTYCEQDGTALLVVTHDPADALALAHRIIVFDAGRVVQSGTAEELRSRPQHDLVRELLGDPIDRPGPTLG